jgi:sec-independent protein translocase protein TatB|tara:strand:+ start:489 stop:971 length:483 start_codon:yes stop_codon:yes gene_type:complete
MFDIGWTEMVVVLVIAVLVVGPKDLPRAIATIGKYIRKARSMAREFQSGINDLAREAELDDIKKDISSTDFNIKKQVEDAVDPTGSMQGMFNDIKPEIKDTPSGNGKAAATASATATTTTPSGDNVEKGAAASADASPASKASSSTSDTSLKSSSETKAS